MIFKRLLGRKKRRTPASEDQEDLVRIVRGDQDAGIRRDACRKVTRLSELRDIASSDLDAGVREIARDQFRKLLCGKVADGLGLTERLAEVAAADDQLVLEQVARGGQEAELRGAAIARTLNPEALCDCALNDALAANRYTAVERLDDKSALEQVVRKIGKKDKRVYRAARRKLKEITEREALPERIRAQCEELCEKLGRLGRFGHWVQDRAFLDLLDRQWAQIEPQADQDRKARYQALRGRFLSAYERYRSEHQAQIVAEEALEAIRNERGALIEELGALSTLGDEVQAVQGLERIATRWGELDNLPEKEQAILERKYRAMREEVAGRLEELTAIVRRNRQLYELIGRAEQVLEQTKPLDSKQVRGLTEQAKPLLDAKGADKTAAARFAEVREALDERLREQKKQAEERLAVLPARLDELTSAVERGALKEAEPLYRGMATGIELAEFSGLPRGAYAEATTRLRALAPRLRELQKWRKWGTDQHRQELCIAMEGLVSDDLRLEAMAMRLHELQIEWKGLDKGGYPVNRPLWERFHNASGRVYEHCKPYLDAQAAEREANRQQREQLCRELEAFLDHVDWERMDWKKAARAELQMRQAWSAMGPVEGRHRKSLERRYRNAKKHLDGHLAEERSRNQAHKHELIARVEALAEEPDLGRAIDETKSLQRQWHTTVSARQKDENRLWQRFRAACDAVFARRREQQEVYSAELTENLHRREDLCAEAERLASSDSGAEELIAALPELDRRWRGSEALPVPRQAAAGLSQRWRTARGLVEASRRKRLKEQRREDLDLLADQAGLCERLERNLENEAVTDAALAAVTADWQALPKQRNPDLQAAMEQRFSRALEALNEGGERLLALRSALGADGKRRAELCLHLEILAQVDSPPELTEQRLQFQVTRLTEHMREGEKDPLEATSRLLQEWYLCGPAPASEAVALDERFERARRAVEEAERDNEVARPDGQGAHPENV